ncbi:hypothetical protein ACI2L1_31260 [Streptomyces sp. NPDC019531]|uniref:hypothetical protein n=1 Tax=Streptomyces sp. NPDC019531 TaxID=3365062 RepID=UPI00384E001E
MSSAHPPSGNAPLPSPSLLPALVAALRRTPASPPGLHPEDRTALSAARYAVGL